MLSQNVLVKAKKAKESLYDGVCTIYEQQKIQKANKSTGFESVKVVENQPCRLSFSTITSANQGENGASLKQTVKLFMSPDVTVKAGSRIVVTQNNKTTEYKCSGESAVYSTHQEIILELLDGFA